MRAGALTQRVSIDRLDEGLDPYGEPFSTWTPLFTSWAAVEPIAGREYFAAQAVQSEVTTRITMRYRPGVESADRVTHAGREYDIVSVIDYRSAHRELVLMCKTRD